jgi:Trypsin-co-occurring domain 1
MAKKLLELNAENGGSILVAVDVPESAVGPVAKPGEILIEKVDRSFEAVKDLIIDSSRPLMEAFHILHKEGNAESAEVEFGINFTLKGNVYLVETSGAASLKVKVTWNLYNQNKEGVSSNELGASLG